MSEHAIPNGGFRWTCPICSASRLNATENDDGEDHAIAALQAHILATDDAEHGPRNEFPRAFDDLYLAAHVVEERRDGEAASS